MALNPYAPKPDQLPETIPVFPLSGVLLLPFGHLPLHIFEPRYRAMTEDAMASDRLIGMVQPRDSGKGKTDNQGDRAVYKTGCAGKITEFSETEDGRYMVTLSGICRFDVDRELPRLRGYRRIRPKWDPYLNDLQQDEKPGIDRARLKKLLEQYFDENGMECDWEAIDKAPAGKLMTCLSMICPFEAREKQALLEAPCGGTRAKMFMTMLEIAVRSNATPQSHH